MIAPAMRQATNGLKSTTSTKKIFVPQEIQCHFMRDASCTSVSRREALMKTMTPSLLTSSRCQLFGRCAPPLSGSGRSIAKILGVHHATVLDAAA